MAKHPTSSRVHREDHGPDDAFVTTVKQGYAWGRENRRVLTVVLTVVVLTALGGIWYISQQRQLEAQATARFNQVQQTVASGNTQLAIRDLQTYLDRFGGTKASNQARILLAGILLAEERGDEAVQALGRLPDDLDEPLGLAAARLQAAAYEESGNLEEAVGSYDRIADGARFPFERREALGAAARIRLENGEPEEALRLYERIVATFEEDEAGRAYYAMWLAEARAQAEGGVTTADAPARTAPDTATVPDDRG